MDKNEAVDKLLEGYPSNMQPKDVARFLNVSLSTVYNLIKQTDIPVLTIPKGRLHLIPKHRFSMWYARQIEGDAAQAPNR